MKECEKIKIDNILGADFVEQYLFDEYVTPTRCTRAEKEFRKKIIRKLVIAGVQKSEITEYFEHRFGLSKKQVNKYFSEVSKDMIVEGRKESEMMFALSVARLEDALTACIMTKDMTNRIRVMKELNEIQGLRVQKHELGGPGGDGIQLILDSDFVPKNESKPEQHPQPVS
jgi:hypothetical protein